MRKIRVCSTPELIHLYDLEKNIVVVTDIFRATSCIVTGLAHHITSITPVASLDECKNLQDNGYVGAAERDAKLVAGFSLDNSPFSYMNPDYKNKKIAMTTTNGTLSIAKSKPTAFQILAGAFLNISKTAAYLKSKANDVVIVCAGWKGNPSLEDTLYAGGLVELLKNDFEIADDSATMALNLYNEGKHDLNSYLAHASHLKRLQGLGIEKDIAFCLQHDIYDIIVGLNENNELVLVN